MMPSFMPHHEHSAIEIVLIGVGKLTACCIQPGIVDNYVNPFFAKSHQIDIAAAERTLSVVDYDQRGPIRFQLWSSRNPLDRHEDA